jgi:hypothetical protein
MTRERDSRYASARGDVRYIAVGEADAAAYAVGARAEPTRMTTDGRRAPASPAIADAVGLTGDRGLMLGRQA